MSTEDPLLPLSEVARRAHVTEAEVRKWIRDGELVTELVDRVPMVRRSVLDAAPHEAGIPVRMAMNRVRMNAFRAKYDGYAPPATPDPGHWVPADELVPTSEIDAVRSQLETLWVPERRPPQRADDTCEWPILATFDPDAERSALDAMTERSIEGVSTTAYVQAAGRSRWWPIAADGAPDRVRLYEVGLSLTDPDLTRDRLERARAEIAQRCVSIGRCSVEPRGSLRDAWRKVEQFLSLTERHDWSSSLSLHREGGVERGALLEVLYALGFADSEASTWAWMTGDGAMGDRDVIRISNDAPEVVSIWLDVPRVAQPIRVAAVALAVAKLLQRGLGGQLFDGEGVPLDEAAFLAATTERVDRLRVAGLECGGTAMYIL